VLGLKAGLMAIGRFVGNGWARTRKENLREVVRNECSGNSRRGDKEESWDYYYYRSLRL